jgi:hypothetical protein
MSTIFWLGLQRRHAHDELAALIAAAVKRAACAGAGRYRNVVKGLRPSHMSLSLIYPISQYRYLGLWRQ